MVLGRARHAPRPLGTPPRASPLNRLAILTALVADGPPIARAVLGHESIASVPVLHVTGTAPNRHPVPKTFEMFERAGTAHVYRAEIDGLEHSHFVVHGGVVLLAWERRVIPNRAAVCRSVPGGSGARTRLCSTRRDHSGRHSADLPFRRPLIPSV